MEDNTADLVSKTQGGIKHRLYQTILYFVDNQFEEKRPLDSKIYQLHSFQI